MVVLRSLRKPSDNMPIYEYHCKTCNGTFERRFTSSKDADKVKCPCGAKPERKVSRTSRPKFKGSGFYEVDYGGK